MIVVEQPKLSILVLQNESGIALVESSANTKPSVEWLRILCSPSRLTISF